MSEQDWERVADSTWRLKIPEGWLYLYERGAIYRPTMVFVPEKPDGNYPHSKDH